MCGVITKKVLEVVSFYNFYICYHIHKFVQFFHFILSTLLFPISLFFKWSRTGQLVFNNLYKLDKPLVFEILTAKSAVFDRLIVKSGIHRFSKVGSDKIYLRITYAVSDVREDQVETNRPINCKTHYWLSACYAKLKRTPCGSLLA